MTDGKQGTRWYNIDDLRNWEANYRHSDLGAIVLSIQKFGYNWPVAIDSDNVVRAGNHRLMALRELERQQWTPHGSCIQENGNGVEIACVDISHLSEDELVGFAIADNRTSALATDDAEALAALLQQIASEDENLLLASGYDGDDLDALLEELTPFEPPTDAGAQVDKAAELQEKWQVARGDVWVIESKTGEGIHKIMCGDSTDADDVALLMDGVKMQGVFTSPPYAEQRKAQYGGTPVDEYVDWWDGVQACVRSVLKEDGSFFVNIKPHSENYERVLYVFDLVLAMRRRWGWLFIDEYCWKKTAFPRDPHLNKKFKVGFESVYYFALSIEYKFLPGNATHFSMDAMKNTISNNPTLGQTQGRGHNLMMEQYEGEAYPSTMVEAFGTGTGHSAAFPVGLPEFFIKAYSDNGDTWYDPFLGSGTAICACEQTKRIGYGMEISEAYCSVALERLSALGLEPTLEQQPERQTNG